jgi:hypothetical protein
MPSTHTSRIWLSALAAIVPLLGSTSAVAGKIQFTVTNNQPTSSGFAFSPVWFGVQDGTYQTFTAGAAVSPGLQNVAELADTSILSAAFAGHGSDTTVGSAPIGPGAVVSGTLDVADPATNRFLDLAAMVVPSNDFFFANQDPKAYELFDAAGQFTGPLTIQVFGSDVWDAGSEVNDAAFGAAFIVGVAITDHVAENGVVTQVFGGPIDYSSYLNSINGQATPYGYNISHLIGPGDLIATINVESVPEPSTLVMVGLGAVGLAVAARRTGSPRSPDVV